MYNTYRKAIAALEAQTPIRFGARDFHRSLSAESGIYVVSSYEGDTAEILYVGKAKSLRDRIYSNLFQGDDAAHTLSRKLISRRGLNNKAEVKEFLRRACAVRFHVEPDPKERSYLEHFAIAHFRSPLND